MIQIDSLKSVLPTAPNINNHIVLSDGVLKQGNATYQRTRISTSGWRTLASLVIADAKFDSQRKRALVTSLRHFDTCLDSPIRIYRFSNHKIVEVLRSLQYFANCEKKTVGCLQLTSIGQIRNIQGGVNVFPALTGKAWIPLVLDSWGIDWRTPGSNADQFELDPQEQRLIRCLSRIVAIDNRFMKLRHRIGFELLSSDLLSVAIRTKILPYLDDQQIQNVWRHWDAYCELARLNPKLLPLLTLWLESNQAPEGIDGKQAMKELKGWFLSLLTPNKAPNSVWIWMCKHGTRSFRSYIAADGFTASQIAQIVSTFADVNYTESIAPKFLKVLLAHNGVPTPGKPWCKLPQSARSVALNQAKSMEKNKGFSQWCNHALTVLFSVTAPHFKFNDSSSLRNWAGLEKQAKKSNATHPAALGENQLWDSPAGQLNLYGLEVSPITSSHDLAQIGMELRNCAADFLPQCVSGQIHLYAIKSRINKAKAIFSIRKKNSSFGSSWVIGEVKGRANSTPPPVSFLIANQILNLHNN